MKIRLHLLEKTGRPRRRARGQPPWSLQRGDRDPTAAAANLRTLAPGVRQVEALAAELEAEQAEFDEEMSSMEMKKRHFASYNVAYSRSMEGKAKRRPPAS